VHRGAVRQGEVGVGRDEHVPVGWRHAGHAGAQRAARAGPAHL
jgi:hypothetical protein